MAGPNKPPIIIKKIKKGGGHGHHGGSWKIAYADFVTAMMAFFLLMWLLNATSEEQKRGIANYFSPVSVGTQGGGNWGVMGGMSIADKSGTMSASKSEIEVKPQPTREKGLGSTSKIQGKTASISPQEMVKHNDSEEEKKEEDEKKAAEDQDEDAKKDSNKDNNKLAEASIHGEDVAPVAEKVTNLEKEQKLFKEISEQLKQSIQKSPELKDLFDNMIIEQTEEGLRIQIIDREKKAMFPNGGSRMYKQMQDLLEHVAQAIKNIPNRISISGHTDASPYANNRTFGNWELSTERANASRRVLRDSGVDESRFESVVGRADNELFNKADPKSEENRRISIVLLHQQHH